MIIEYKNREDIKVYVCGQVRMKVSKRYGREVKGMDRKDKGY